jgi:hypothetical protein
MLKLRLVSSKKQNISRKGAKVFKRTVEKIKVTQSNVRVTYIRGIRPLENLRAFA